MIGYKLAVHKILGEIQYWRSHPRGRTGHGGKNIKMEQTLQHNIIKTETKNMKISQLRQLATQEEQTLISQLQEYLLHEDFNDDLILFDEPASSPSEKKRTSLDFELFKQLNKLECFHRKRGSWYTEEQLQELSKLLNQYPDRKNTIRSALKIPRASFSKLLREINTQRNYLKIPKWRYGRRSKLTDEQKKYIEIFVKPPWRSLTISDI